MRYSLSLYIYIYMYSTHTNTHNVKFCQANVRSANIAVVANAGQTVSCELFFFSKGIMTYRMSSRKKELCGRKKKYK